MNGNVKFSATSTMKSIVILNTYAYFNKFKKWIKSKTANGEYLKNETNGWCLINETKKNAKWKFDKLCKIW